MHVPPTHALFCAAQSVVAGSHPDPSLKQRATDEPLHPTTPGVQISGLQMGGVAPESQYSVAVQSSKSVELVPLFVHEYTSPPWHCRVP